MATQQKIGPPGSEIDLRNLTGIIVSSEMTGPEPVVNEILAQLPNGTVSLPRHQITHYEWTMPFIIKAVGHQARITLYRALESMLEQATLAYTTFGAEGTYAFYTEQFGDQVSADVYPIVKGIIPPGSRETFATHTGGEIRLTTLKRL